MHIHDFGLGFYPMRLFPCRHAYGRMLRGFCLHSAAHSRHRVFTHPWLFSTSFPGLPHRSQTWALCSSVSSRMSVALFGSGSTSSRSVPYFSYTARTLTFICPRRSTASSASGHQPLPTGYLILSPISLSPYMMLLSCASL